MMDKNQKKQTEDKTRKYIIRFIAGIFTTAIIAGTTIAMYKLNKGEKIGNAKFSIEKSDHDKTLMKTLKQCRLSVLFFVIIKLG